MVDILLNIKIQFSYIFIQITFIHLMNSKEWSVLNVILFNEKMWFSY